MLLAAAALLAPLAFVLQRRSSTTYVMQQMSATAERTSGTLHQSQGAKGAVALPVVPSENDVHIAAQARRVKVYVYDLAAAGFQPAQRLLDADGPACTQCKPVLEARWVGSFVLDACNGYFGRLHQRLFAAPFQDNYFANNAFGHGSAGAIHSRLMSSYRRCSPAMHANSTSFHM